MVATDTSKTTQHEETCEYDKICKSVEYVKTVITKAPKIGIVCGSGLGDLVHMLENPIAIPYSKIPHLPVSTVVGHTGEFVFGELDKVPIVCMRGRVHCYEGYNVVETVRPIRLMAMLGIKLLCVTNAAGSVNKNFKAGDFMIIKDHISLFAYPNPLIGPHDPRFGERFVTMSNAYDSELISELEEAAVACNLDQHVRRGTYTMVIGPTFETVAEARFLKMAGSDAVGMSTVHEVIAAHQMGVKCVGISLLTNPVLTDYDSMEDMVEHEGVIDMGRQRSQDFIKWVAQFIKSVRKDIKV